MKKPRLVIPHKKYLHSDTTVVCPYLIDVLTTEPIMDFFLGNPCKAADPLEISKQIHGHLNTDLFFCTNDECLKHDAYLGDMDTYYWCAYTGRLSSYYHVRAPQSLLFNRDAYILGPYMEKFFPERFR